MTRHTQWALDWEGGRPAAIGEAYWNMALDAANLDAAMNGSICRVRHYQWSSPAVTLGRFQDVGKALNLRRCRELAIAVARRPTGGRGILHGGDLTVSIAARLLEIGLPADASVGHIYDHLSAIFVQAFALVGVDGARGACGRSPALHSGNCMATVTRADVVERATGAKLLGAALLRRSDAILLQCTIPVAAEHWSHSISPDSIFRPGAPDGAAPRTVSSAPAAAGELRAAIVQALTALFGREPAGKAVTDDEAAQVARRAGEHIVEV